MVMFKRTCQECFHVQLDVDPGAISKARLDAYTERKCKKCKSIGSLDWGSADIPREEGDEDWGPDDDYREITHFE